MASHNVLLPMLLVSLLCCSPFSIARGLLMNGSTVSKAEPNQAAVGDICGSASEGGSITLSCYGGKISSITFASFGNPQGSCVFGGKFTKGKCDAPNTSSIVRTACVGRESCIIDASEATFGPTPCSEEKSLAVTGTCSK